MPDDTLLERMRTALRSLPVTEQRMFGGTCFMLSGNMLACVSKRGLLVRVGKDMHAAALARPHTRTMEMRGRAMEGYVFVEPAGTGTDEDLQSWVQPALAFVQTLPPKSKPAKSRRT